MIIGLANKPCVSQINKVIRSFIFLTSVIAIRYYGNLDHEVRDIVLLPITVLSQGPLPTSAVTRYYDIITMITEIMTKKREYSVSSHKVQVFLCPITAF